MKELSMSVTSVNIELLHRLILYVTYSLYMKKSIMTNQCDFIATPKGNLACHIQSVIEGDNYECR